MPRKPFKKQAGYQYHNRGRSYNLNQTVKDIQFYRDPTARRYVRLRRAGLVIRNPHKSPLLSNGGAK